MIVVDTAEDSFDGRCDDGDCSQRDAVKDAPAGARVLVPAGFYALSVAGGGGVGEGSIELRRRIEIVGDGETGAFIDATALGAPAFTAAARDEDAGLALKHLTIFGAQDPARTGGALRIEGGSVRLVDVTVTGGSAQRGGGIAVDAGAELTLVDSLVFGNDAARRGGGIWNAGTLAVSASTVANNRAIEGGGIGSAHGSVVSLANTTIAENVATARGGGLWLAGRSEIAASTIADNQAARGGGVTVAGGGAGIARSIVAGNRADRARQCDGPLLSAGGNVDQGHRCGFDAAHDLEDTDPQLGRLGPNGGPTFTMALSVRSPAVDIAGDCGGRDLRGAPREPRCDAGSYELVRCLGKPVDVVGTPRDDELSGGRGRDVFLGLGDDDEFQGSIGRDRACGGSGDDLLIAGPGADRFDGEAGADRVRGESGDDVVVGGSGRDRLVGGPGDDACEGDARDRRARGCEVFFGGAARPAT